MNQVATFLETERLRLRPLRADDLELFVDLDSDPEVMRYLTGGAPQSREHYEKRVPELLLYMSENPGLGLWPTYLKDTNEFIGWYILKHLPDNGEVEVGFRIKKKFWSKGYSTEAGKALIKHGFETVGLEKIAAIVDPENLASQAVIKKIGLKQKGTGVWYGVECLYFELNLSSL
ncbi:MAG: GNAT family N-acetyltransferase [Flavobacteriales bacterium]|nr:GNAT family N-acetyltransferase [Flavobacteriales bacterium]